MRYSIFTPSHRPTYLAALYGSLVAQTEQDWEWVILPNGDCKDLPLKLETGDTRVIVLNSVPQAGVGSLKRQVVEHCTGQIMVEVDHDDMLEPNALRLIGEAVEDGAGFVYSDFANFREDGTCEVYDAKWGWEHYTHQPKSGPWQETHLTAHRAFEANAASLSAIFYAPNHVRAWTREAYDKAGGYDAALDICDDYDLVVRTYLAGIVFAHVPECLYLYRLHASGQQTYLERNADIQTKQAEISRKYFYRLTEEWAKREGLPSYDLGSGPNKPQGYLSVDLRDADVICDVRKGLPWADNSVGRIRCSDFLEHVPSCVNSTCEHGPSDKANLGGGGDVTWGGCTVFVMNEIYRVLAPGGWLITCTPCTDGRGAFMDPTHVSYWNRCSFFYYTRRDQQRFVPGIKARFQEHNPWNGFPTDWHKLHEIAYFRADYCALKGQRQSGEVFV